ncbi:bifunctional DNA-formamidopyrimidine glycosylase/DNA-(apurinic or apyrimidinic site) lyase [Candidatus Electronema sp. JC]|uniref:bifunctional DNA-formamidopyrimidine glycosylase/DNA-(apurinic or apyrimidinic site) lyase n=1 Tax=Candidatus Electronema sp. JC TaxID=3401570 RepID=UPI003AA9461F
MPELPEVEVTRRGLLPHLPGRTVTAAHWSGKRLRQSMPVKLLKEAICGGAVASLDRRAKYLLIRMDSGSVLVVHLGMTGKLGIFPQTAARRTHDHLCLSLDNGMELRFNDARRFGSVAVWPGAEATRLEEVFSRSQGIEPFGPDFTAETLARRAEWRRQAVKLFLMDAKLIAGIGNIYANETLFAAGVHPQTPAGSLSLAQWRRVAACAVDILHRAIAAGGSTVSDFLSSNGQPGWFQLQLAVYSRHGQPCAACQELIRKEVIGGRATFFCPRCQPLPAAQSAGD